MREEAAVGGGLDTSVTPSILMVDGARRSMGPLANWTLVGDEVPVHNIIRSRSCCELKIPYPPTAHGDAF